ncbi:MAG: GDSL-type esterase/lipase family protein [Bacteroidota bacterium]|nr:GDSL-type esterase/lipase family protein [Bacteroidota bacterium]
MTLKTGNNYRMNNKLLNTLLILFIFSCKNLLFAQVSPFAFEDYTFVDKQFNKIDIYGSDTKYKNLYSKMEKMLLSGEGNINIVHFGGSHIQADIWSGRTRNQLQELMPGSSGARGFLFPFKMGKTNNPYHYLIDYNGSWTTHRNVEKNKDGLLGVSGISVTTEDTLSSIKIYFREGQPTSYYHNRVKIFHHLTDSSYHIIPINAGNYKEFNYPLKGYTEFIFDQKKDTLELEIRKTGESQKYFTLFGFSLENDEPGFTYHSIGVNGASVPSYNRCSLLPTHLAAIKPDLIIFSIGINDIYDSDFTAKRYLQNYDTLLLNIKAAWPNTAILFTTNTDSYYKKKYANEKSLEAREVMIKLAEKHGAGVWDMLNVMGGVGSIKNWERQGMAKRDLIHLTPDGYKIMGDLMFNAILNSYIKYSIGNP